MTTRQETKTHFMGSTFACQTACGRFVATTGSSVQTSAAPADVDCEKCRKAMAA